MAATKTLLTFLAILTVRSVIFLSLFSQNRPTVIQGLILDATTREAIPFAHISDLKSGATVSSDSTGRFQLTFSDFPVRIVFQHIAYFSDTLTINTNKDFKKFFSSNENIFFLRTNVFMIDEVMIRANARKLFDNEPFAIIEYELLKDRIVALGYRNYNELKKEVVVADYDGKIIWTCPRPKINELFRDCLGALYLVESDSAKLVTIRGDSLQIRSGCKINYFRDFIQTVHVVTDSMTVFSKTSPVKQYRNYFLIRGQNKEAERIYLAGNMDKEPILQAYNETISTAFREVVKTNDVSYLEFLYRLAFTTMYEKHTEYKPVFTEIFRTGDSLLLFDFTTFKLLRFSKKVDKYWETPMNIAFNRDWRHQLHHDAVTNRFYLEFANGTYSYLIEIDPVTGTELRKIPIPTYNHIDHIQVNNNRIWFLHQPDIGDRGKKLYYLDF